MTKNPWVFYRALFVGILVAVAMVFALHRIFDPKVLHPHVEEALLSADEARQLEAEYQEKDGLAGLMDMTKKINSSIRSAAKSNQFETYIDITEYEANVRIFVMKRLQDKGYHVFTKTVTSTGVYTTRVEVVLVINWEKNEDNDNR